MADPVLPQIYIPPDVLDLERHNYQRGFELLTRPKSPPSRVLPSYPGLNGRAPQRMGPAGPTGHKRGYRFEGVEFRNEGLLPAAGADFNAAATAWERQWSSLCPGSDGRFLPVVAETQLLGILGMGTVSAHRGTVQSDNLLQYGNPTIDPKSGWVAGDGVVFVGTAKRDGKTVERTFGSPQRDYDVLTTVDGQVLAVLGTFDREALQDANWVIDLVLAPMLAPMMIELAYGTARLCSVLVSQVRGRLARAAMSGPTRELTERALLAAAAEESAAKAAADAAARQAYNPVAGITRDHHMAFVGAADETGLTIVVRHTNPKSISLIERGCPGKPKNLEFINTSPQSGIVMANTATEVQQAQRLGYLVVGEGKVAQRIVVKNGAEVVENVPLRESFWQLEKGQVIDPALHKPIVGDYDLMGVIDPAAPGRNIGLATKNYGELVTDVTNPTVQRAAKAVNDKMEMDRVLHGAQDTYKGFRKGASAYEPGGRVKHFPTEGEVKAYYESLGRQTHVGQYPRPGPDVKVVDELAKRRAVKPTGWR